MIHLDPDLLRTFLAFVDGGSLARAAETVGRSPSAVTAQMQRLADAVGLPLLETSGRGRALTPAGEELVGHARRILAAQRDAVLSLQGAGASGRVVIGCTQDFADSTLPDHLRVFARSHPRVRIDLRIGRTAELTGAFAAGDLDILLAMRQGAAADEAAVFAEPMIWLASRTAPPQAQDEAPLALLDPPCGFRAAATAAFEASGRAYRIAATSPSLSGLKAAVRSGLAVTARTRLSLEEDIAPAPPGLDLPPLPVAEFTLRMNKGAPRPARTLTDLLGDSLIQPANRH